MARQVQTFRRPDSRRSSGEIRGISRQPPCEGKGIGASPRDHRPPSQREGRGRREHPRIRNSARPDKRRADRSAERSSAFLAVGAVGENSGNRERGRGDGHRVCAEAQHLFCHLFHDHRAARRPRARWCPGVLLHDAAGKHADLSAKSRASRQSRRSRWLVLALRRPGLDLCFPAFLPALTMDESHPDTIAVDPHAAPDEHAGHNVAKHVRKYLLIGLILVTFTAITVWLSYVDFGTQKMNVTVAMAVATFKAGLVAAIFM